MKKIFRLVLTLTVGILFSISAYSQGSGSTHSGNVRPVQPPAFEPTSNPAFGENRALGENRAFEVTRTVKGNLVSLNEGLFSLKTAKGELLNLRITPETKIKIKDEKSGLAKDKLVRVTYVPGESIKKGQEALRIKVLN